MYLLVFTFWFWHFLSLFFFLPDSDPRLCKLSISDAVFPVFQTLILGLQTFYFWRCIFSFPDSDLGFANFLFLTLYLQFSRLWSWVCKLSISDAVFAIFQTLILVFANYLLQAPYLWFSRLCYRFLQNFYVWRCICIFPDSALVNANYSISDAELVVFQTLI